MCYLMHNVFTHNWLSGTQHFDFYTHRRQCVNNLYKTVLINIKIYPFETKWQIVNYVSCFKYNCDFCWFSILVHIATYVTCPNFFTNTKYFINSLYAKHQQNGENIFLDVKKLSAYTYIVLMSPFPSYKSYLIQTSYIMCQGDLMMYNINTLQYEMTVR